MLTQISRKLRREGQTRSTHAPAVANTTYFEADNQWYLPTLTGPSSFLSEVVSAKAVQNVLAVLERLTPDRYQEFVIAFYNEGLQRFGEDWVYADINTALLGLGKMLKVESYLEIGVRRGRSMAMLASAAPQCSIAGFDLWIENYAGMTNPGADFVRAELARIGFHGDVEFIAGDSKITVPKYFAEYPDKYFDMITVDGDHSLEGAKRDLLNVLPRLKVGGALVFDDISNQSFPYLHDLWREVVGDNPQFATYEFREVGFGIAFAIKKY